MFRAEVVGSMLRPAYLKEARQALAGGEISAHDFKVVEDRAVDQAIALQEGTGVDVVTDGEMRRSIFFGPITEAVEGIEQVDGGIPMPRFGVEGAVDYALPVAVTGKLRRLRSVVCEEYSYARGRARKPLKVTVPSALSLYGLWDAQFSAGAYPDPFAMFADCAELGRSEIRELVRLGCTYVQVDAPELATLVDPRIRDWAESKGMSPERMLTEGIDLINAMVDGIDGVRFGIHLCRGNNHGGLWMAEGGYDYIAEALFKRATAFDTFMLEYDDARSGTFEPLGFAEEDSQIVLGLVSTKSDRRETVDELLDRLEQAGRRFPHEQLGLSTQCGFASSFDGNPITEEVQMRKLRLVAEVARSAWS